MESQKVKKNKKNNQPGDETGPVLTKEETKVLNDLRLNCPFKQGSLQGMKVDFFIGNKLIDYLMDSKWGPGLNTTTGAKASKSSALFTSRQACIHFMQRLMNKQMLYRAVKIYKDQVQSSDKDGDKSDSQGNTPNLRKRTKNTTATTTSNTATDDGSETPKSETPTPKKEGSQNVKRKFKLDAHEDQKFVDANEPFVWVYETTSTKTFIIGSLLILGAIAVCLFPLWPSIVREGVYYVSLAGAIFLGAILGLAVLKYIVYAFVKVASLGSVEFWLFPNLTEDVGFFESFVPVYKCNCSSSVEDKKKGNKKSGEEKEDEAAASDDSKNVNIVTNELSKSTVDINTVKVDTPLTRSSARKKSLAIEDDFEMVNNDEVKETN